MSLDVVLRNDCRNTDKKDEDVPDKPQPYRAYKSLTAVLLLISTKKNQIRM